MSTIRRREFLEAAAGGLAVAAVHLGSQKNSSAAPKEKRCSVGDVRPNEDIFTYIHRIQGAYDATIYKQILGAANEFKEGDQIVGVAAADEASRANARELLANTTIEDIVRHPVLEDQLYALLRRTVAASTSKELAKQTLGKLKQFLLIQFPRIKYVRG